MRTLAIFIPAFLGALFVSGEEKSLPEPSHLDIAYGQHPRHRIDLWKAKSGSPTPLLVFIHGGGWAGGEKGDLPPALLSAMLMGGVSVASINYRYSTETPLPAPVHDAARAVQFLRSKAGEFGLRQDRFAAYGISAGGTTTLWLATHDDLADPASDDLVARQSSRLQVAVAMSPQPSLEPEVVVSWVGEKVLDHPMIPRAVGAKSREALAALSPEQTLTLREFSAIRHLSAGDPPILISHPRVDPLPAESAGSAIHHAVFGTKFAEAATNAGVKCLHRLQDQPDKTPTPEAFLIEHLTR